MRVLIVGEGKSGTTALMRSVVACLDDPVELFEPKAITAADLAPESVVVKKLLLNWTKPENKLLGDFDKRLLITRDPRDRIISHLLYDAYNRAPQLPAERRERWLAALQQKIDNPTKHSVSWLINVWFRVSRADLVSHYVRALDRGLSFQRRNGESFHTVSYEDYVSGSFAGLNSYLDLTIEAGVVQGAESRVSRSKASGAWREWFTRSDVSLFRPMTHRWLDETGGNPGDWELTPATSLDPATSVDYVRALFDRVPEPDADALKKRAKSRQKGRKKKPGSL